MGYEREYITPGQKEVCMNRGRQSTGLMGVTYHSPNDNTTCSRTMMSYFRKPFLLDILKTRRRSNIETNQKDICLRVG